MLKTLFPHLLPSWWLELIWLMRTAKWCPPPSVSTTPRISLLRTNICSRTKHFGIQRTTPHMLLFGQEKLVGTFSYLNL